MKFGKNSGYKKCPRCGNKCLQAQSECEECGLIFSRMEYASNKAAKRKLRHFDTDFVIYTNQYPKDVSYIKLLLLTTFLGITGAHYYYVGKYVKGGLMTACFVYLVFCTIFNAQMVEYLETYYLYLPIGIAAFAWIASLIYVITKKFKVPVTIDMSMATANVVDVEYARKEFNKVTEELKNENLKNKNKKKKNDVVEDVKKSEDGDKK